MIKAPGCVEMSVCKRCINNPLVKSIICSEKYSFLCRCSGFPLILENFQKWQYTWKIQEFCHFYKSLWKMVQTGKGVGFSLTAFCLGTGTMQHPLNCWNRLEKVLLWVLSVRRSGNPGCCKQSRISSYLFEALLSFKILKKRIVLLQILRQHLSLIHVSKQRLGVLRSLPLRQIYMARETELNIRPSRAIIKDVGLLSRL